ncbi:MAG: ATPase [Treponema sp.]|nr:ATPase [Treponema sp.]
MARTAQMKLLELMVLKEDISPVVEYIGKKENFQFVTKKHAAKPNGKLNVAESNAALNLFSADAETYSQLKSACIELQIDTSSIDMKNCSAPTDFERNEAARLIESYTALKQRNEAASENFVKITDARKEVLAFANLKVPYSELEHLSFLSMKIGRIAPSDFDKIKFALDGSAQVIALGEDKSHILVASSKKGRFAIDTELKNYGFVPVEIPENFNGVPEDVLQGLDKKLAEAREAVDELVVERMNFVETHKEKLLNLLGDFSLEVQIDSITKDLESTELVYRITGWIYVNDVQTYMKDLDEITEGRIVIREYDVHEVVDVVNGKEEVPVKLRHGSFVKSFERMVFSYGAPVYGTIDPTPFVAVFFTILFGIMFGDCGQGLCFLILGILMSLKVIKFGNWNKFAPIFMAIGISSSVMGLLTGEFFGTEKILEPFALWVTGLFGHPHAPILHLMPSDDPNSIYVMFGVFGVAVAIGFVINTCGLVINMINNVIRKKYAEALFGKNGLAGAVFFWYLIALVLRIVLQHHKVAVYDIVIIAIALFFAAFAEPFERAMNKEKPLLENGFGTYLISSVVELIEVFSGYLSNTISFVRVGAFALSHAVLNFTIMTLTTMCGGVASVGGIIVLILGNALIIVLEGMIVAIQVIRLQYYEFFSKFFHENGREFKPFVFEPISDK